MECCCSFYFFFLVSSSLIILCHSMETLSPSSPLSSLKKKRCQDDEMAALLQFKHSFVINTKLESWKEGDDCCSWDGVECDDQQTDHHHHHHHVISLNLRNSSLYGSINSSSSLFTLTHLQRLDLSANDFNSSHIPSAIGNLTSLQELNISYAKFTGELPVSLGNLTQLDFFNLWDGNQISPDSLAATSSLSWIGKLTKLTYLDLGNKNLKGEIPYWLMNLTQLTLLYMNGNQLTGPIPSFLMSLPQLNYIDLSQNQLTGQIPSNFNHQFRLLDLSSNNLEGSIPTNLSKLHNLETLSLDDNRFVGSVELSLFFQLKNLTSLYLSYNKLSLSLKNISSKNDNSFPSLRFLGLASCNVSEFPASLENSKNEWEYLDLSDNHLGGQIPQRIFDLGQNSECGLYLNLSRNLLTGFERGHSLFHPQFKLRVLDLRHNMLKGSLPTPLLSSSSSTFLIFSSYLLSNNSLSGEVSHLICNLTNLMYLDLSFNSFSGKLPQCLSNFSDSLLLLDLRGNKFDGNIPSTWRNECQLRMISMSHNQFHGQLPRSLANCSSLELVDFGNNQINDTFPSWLNNVTNLSILILRSNSLHGVITNDFGFSNLRVLALSNNSFRGKLPSKFIDTSNPMRALHASKTVDYMEQIMKPNGYWSSEVFGQFDYSMTMHNKGSELIYTKIPYIFCAIDFSSNHFEGQIPDEFGDLAGLQVLNLSGNNLSGHIPSSFSNMKNLESLDLSRNQLSGQIPMELTKLTFLSSFEVSFNNLSGPIPQGNQFCNYDPKSYEGNPGLFVETWNKQCGNARSLPRLQQPPSPTGEEEDDEFKNKWMIILIGFVSGLVAGVILGNELIARKQYWFVKTLARIVIWIR